MLKRSASVSLLLGIVSILLTLPPVVSAAAEARPSPQSGTLLMRMATGYVTATALNTDVNIRVNGLVARVSVMQEFRNTGSEWVEGEYVFPLPEGAAVDQLRLHIGERFIEGEIREKDQARREYNQAKNEGRKTSLVEQQRANLFTTSVANIAPGETVIVEIEYLEDVRYDDGTFSLRFPMTLTPRYVPGTSLPDRQGSGWSPDTDQVDDASMITPPMVSASNGHRVSLTANVNAGMPLQIIASRYHPVRVAEAGGRYAVSLANGRDPMDHDFELLWRPTPSNEPRAMLFTETIDAQPHQLLMVVPPDVRTSTPVVAPREFIVVVDTSGSMHGVSMQQARQAVQRALQGLRPGDTFNVIQFNSVTEALFDASVPATPANQQAAQRFVSGLRASGGTEMAGALQLALGGQMDESRLRQVIFVTDGAVGNEEALFRQIDTELGATRLFTVGIGSAPNSWFMRRAAETGRGSFTMISALHEVGEKMDRLFRKLENPQVTNINVSWPGGSVVEAYPAVVPDLYLGEPVVIRARAEGPYRPGDQVRISGDSPAGAWSRELALDSGQQSAGVGALWARARIAELLIQQQQGADPDGIRDAVVTVALQHHLVSRHTSLVAVDKTPVRPAGDLLNKEQIASLMPYGQSGAAIFGFPATATGAPLMLITGLLSLLLALTVAGWRRRPSQRLA